MSIGGIFTKNNIYSSKAKTKVGSFLNAHKITKQLLKDQLIRQLPTITRVRNKRQETFYCITGKGANYIGRREELKSKVPKSPNNVMHESMKFDIALAFLRLYPDYDITIRYDVIVNRIKPDITIFLENRNTGFKYHFLVEIERKKTIDLVYKGKVLLYNTIKPEHLKQAGLRPETKYLIIYADWKFDGFLRPIEYIDQREIALMEKRIKKLAEMSKDLPDKYRFLSFNNFEKINQPIWLSNKNNKSAII